MKTIALLGLVASLLTAAPAFADTAGSSGLCGPDGPEAYKRPGGYCEILGANSSLSTHASADTNPAAPEGPKYGLCGDVPTCKL